MRRVVLHYHLFKNAGTTVDGLLERNFGSSWAQFEGDHAAARLKPVEVAAFIDANPGVKAVSSHHARLPVPAIKGGRVVPLVLLRHPLDRVGSVYTFERGQGGGSRGADFASKHSFSDYVRWRLDLARNGVINNFHALFLLESFDDRRRPVRAEALGDALERLEELAFFGIVERFPDSIALLGRTLTVDFPGFDVSSYERRNRSNRHDDLDQRLAEMRAELGESLWSELCDRNRLDLDLYDGAVKLFERRLLGVGTPMKAAG